MPEIRTTMTADTSQFDRAMRKAQTTASKSAGGIQSGFRKVGSAFASIASKAGVVGLAIGGISTAIGAISGKNIDLARKSFDDLANSFGVNSDRMLSKLQAVSHGMVTDFELIQAASRAMVLGLQPDAIVSYLEIAAASSKATGQTMTEAFNDITIGVARQSRMILDNLGIIVSVDKANEAYAKQLGITTAELTNNQKALAFQNAVMEAGRRQLNILGSDTEAVFTNTAQLLTRVTNLWDNFANSAGKAFNVVAGWVNSTIDGMSKLYNMVKGTGEQLNSLTGGTFTTTEEPKLKQVGYDMTTPLNGQGVQAEADKAELGKTQAKELEKIYKEISKVIEENTKSDTELIISEYDKRLEAAKGDAKLTKEIMQARDLELIALRDEQAENTKDYLDQQRQELLTERDRQLEDLQVWYEQIAELEGITNEQRIEATQIFEDRKAQIAAEARQKELEEAEKVAKEHERLEKQASDAKKKETQRRTDMIQSFGQTALSMGKAFGEDNFEMQKGLAAGQAIMDTHAAVMKTMASVPYPYNIPLAAAQAAIGAAEVAKILSATPEGGGDTSAAVGGAGGGGGATGGIGEITPTKPATEEKSGTYTINIMGDVLDEEYVDLLAEKISEAVESRNVILKASQARTVR